MRQFEVNQEENTITVFYNGKKTDLNTIRTYISKLGFDADDVKADLVAYEQLDDCCKK
jgi:pantoate kinase